MCRVGPKTYPVTVTAPDEADGFSLEGGTITWRDMVFENVKLGDGCRYNFAAMRDGVTAELCTATQGYANLKIGAVTFECRMRR